MSGVGSDTVLLLLGRRRRVVPNFGERQTKAQETHARARDSKDTRREGSASPSFAPRRYFARSLSFRRNYRQLQVVQRFNNTIKQINHYSLDKYHQKQSQPTELTDSDSVISI